MSSRQTSRGVSPMLQVRKYALLLVSAWAVFLAGFDTSVTAQPLTPVYTFSPYLTAGDGGGPRGALMQASDGNFYGTTSYGGSSGCGYYGPGCGTVFSTALDGTITILHSFSFADGVVPSANVIQASDGNFYGTTSLGGSSSCNGGSGCGTIFKI